MTSLNWRSGRAFCITSNIGILDGLERNLMVSALLRDCFIATAVVRVFSSATATEQTQFEAMAFARSCIDRFIGEGPLPKGVTDRLQCTALGHPMKIVEPTAAAHAAVTPLALQQARLHTISMMEPEGCTWVYNQMDRHQLSTAKETSEELYHNWESDKAASPTQLYRCKSADSRTPTSTLRLRQRTRSSPRLGPTPTISPNGSAASTAASSVAAARRGCHATSSTRHLTVRTRSRNISSLSWPNSALMIKIFAVMSKSEV